MQAEHHDDNFDVDAASHRLNEIYERMNEVRPPGTACPAGHSLPDTATPGVLVAAVDLHC
jgi:hypothetical protein